MREILFRGKTYDTSEWVEGCYLKSVVCKDVYGYIMRDNSRKLNTILLSTIGQYTGLTDKNGKKIFEGDIVKGRHWTSLNNKNPEEYHLWLVDWNEKSGLIVFVNSPTSRARLSIHDFADLEEIEVIGNIHDNPELLKEG